MIFPSTATVRDKPGIPRAIHSFACRSAFALAASYELLAAFCGIAPFHKINPMASATPLALLTRRSRFPCISLIAVAPSPAISVAASSHTRRQKFFTVFLFNSHPLPLTRARIRRTLPLTTSAQGSSARAKNLHLPSRESRDTRSEEHTSELQSPDHLVCRLLLEKKKT